MVWVLVGVRGCVLRPTEHSLVTLFSCLCRLRTCHCNGCQASHIYYPKYILGYGCREDLLLSCHGFRLFLDRLSGWFLGGGPSTALSPGLRSGGLESKFGRGPGPCDRRVVGWFCLCLGYKRGVCFGVPSWHIDSRIAWRSGTACLQSSTVVRTERLKVVKEN